MTVALKRVVSMPMLLLYGMGNILGAGIYVLVGKVAGESGYAAPFAFIVAAIVASFTALSYGELSARYPQSAGEANYVLAAFKKRWLAMVMGLAIVLSGLVSNSALLQGFAAYLQTFVTLPNAWSILLALAVLTGIAVWGIKQSIWVTAIMTIMECAGLIYILVVAWPDAELRNQATHLAWGDFSLFNMALFAGAFVAFYAYVGFEDIVNIAEEVKDPERTMPQALLGALLLTSVVYILVAFVAIARVEPHILSASDAPLALIYESVQSEKAYTISFIALFAVLNGALVNLIMCSRVIYGLACQKLLPAALARVNNRTHTPMNASIAIALLVAVFALTLPLLSLAKITSFILLCVFFIVNAACWRVIRMHPRPKSIHSTIPVLGMVTSVMMISIPLLDWI